MAKWNPFTKASDDKVDDKTKTDASQDALLDRFAAVVEEKNKPLHEAVSNLKKEWETIKAAAEKSDEPPPKSDSELTPEQIAQRDKNSLLALSIATNARITENECISSISGQWSQLIPRVREIFMNTPIQRKGMADYPQYCMNVVDMEVGRAARAAGLRSDGTKFYIEDSASKTGGENSPISEIEAWQGDDRVETASETLAKLKIDPKKFAEDFKAGRLN